MLPIAKNRKRGRDPRHRGSVQMLHRRGRRLALAMVGLLRAAEGQYINGGTVSVSCGDCSCDGTSEDGDVLVFDNPSSGTRVSERGATPPP